MVYVNILRLSNVSEENSFMDMEIKDVHIIFLTSIFTLFSLRSMDQNRVLKSVLWYPLPVAMAGYGQREKMGPRNVLSELKV